MRDERYNFIDSLFGFLGDMIDSGAEVHIVDKTDPDEVVEHVFNAEEEEQDDLEIPFTDVCPYDGSCDECPYERECAEDLADCSGEISCELCDEIISEDDFNVDMWGIPDINRIIFSNPATIVFWEDGTKTVVKCMKGEKFERYAGFAAACMKKMFGNTSRAKSVMEYFAVEQEPKESKTEKKPGNSPINGQISMDEVIKEAVDEALAK